MSPHHRSRGLASFALATVILVTGCTSSGGSDGPSERSDGPTSDEAKEVDTAGAEEVADAMADFLATFRSNMDATGRDDTREEAQAGARELRNALFEADAAVRKVDVGDEELAAAVNDFYEDAADAIDRFDDFTTVDPSSLGAEEGEAVRVATLTSMAAAVNLQDAATSVSFAGGVPTGPKLANVLVTPETANATGDTPAFALVIEGEHPERESGPCGEPSPTLVVEPTAYAASVLDGTEGYVIQRAYAFKDEDEAGAFVEASKGYLDCEEPDGFEDWSVEEIDDGLRLEATTTEGVAAVALVVQDGRRVLFADADGALLPEAENTVETVGGWADSVMELLQKNAAG